MCLFARHDSKCRHVSFPPSGHRVHSGKIFCLKACLLR